GRRARPPGPPSRRCRARFGRPCSPPGREERRRRNMSGRYERNPGRIVELSPGSSRDLLDLRWKDEIARVICVTLVGPPATGPDGANAAVCVALVQWGAGEAETEA